jgi:hypothetical protein
MIWDDHPGSRSRIRIKILFPSRIRIWDPDPGVKKSTGSRIRIRNTGIFSPFEPNKLANIERLQQSNGVLILLVLQKRALAGGFSLRLKSLRQGFPDSMRNESGSVADPDPGSSAFLTPGFGIRAG